MHELSIAANIIEIVEENAGRNADGKVVLIELEIGAMSGVVSEALKMALEISVNGTILENSEIKIYEIPGEAKCNNCNAIFPINYLYSTCPDCNNYDYNITRGNEMKIKSITFESE